MNKKQVKLAMAVALATSSVVNATGYALAKEETQEETDIKEANIENNEQEEIKDQEVIDQENGEAVEEANVITKEVTYVEINDLNFPDEIFREYIKVNFDLNQDGMLSNDELSKVTEINVSDDFRVKSLEGIQNFVNLESLKCSKTGITSLDVSNNTKLGSLYFSDADITELNLNNNPELWYLDCSYTPLTSLDVSNNSKLQTLKLSNTGITSLDVSNNPRLKWLYCSYTPITSLDVSNNPKLFKLHCNNTPIASLDVSKNAELDELMCDNTSISSLDISNNTALTSIKCSNIPITSLDVSNNSKLRALWVSKTGITSLDISNNLALINLRCTDTPITSLDVSNNFKLQQLAVSNTGITSLDVSNNPSLEVLECNNTMLTNLDVSSNFRLKNLSVSDNANLAWLYVGDNLKLHAYLGVVGNNTYTMIDLGEIGETFNIVERFPGIDPNRIINIEGAEIDKTTGIVSGYTNGTPIVYTYDCGNDQKGSVNLKVQLNFQTESQLGKSSITINEELSKAYDGIAVAKPKVTVTGSSGAVSFEWYTADGTKLAEAPAEVGNYKVKAILAGDENYKGAETEAEFSISKASNAWTTELSMQGWVYGEEVNTPQAEVQFGKITYTYSTSEDGVYTEEVPSDAGVYWVKASVEGTNNYEGLEAKVSFTINKASSSITIDTDLNKVYDGQPVSEPSITQTGSQSTPVYEWYVKDEGTARTDIWTKLAEAPVEVGKYKLVVSVAEDINYSSATIEQEFSISEVVNTPEEVPTPPNGGTITNPDGSTETIQPGEILRPNNPNDESTETSGEEIGGVQTGDKTQVGLWTVLAGLAAGIMVFFTNKKRKEEL